MSGLFTLVRHSLRRRRGFLGIAVVMMLAFQLFTIAAGRALEKSGGMRQMGSLMPNFLERWTNMMAASFRGFVLFGYSHPMVELFLVATAISIGTELAEEIETKFIDLMMARPLHRSVAVNRTVVVLIATMAIVIASMLAGTSIGLRLLTPPDTTPPDRGVILSLATNLSLLVLAWGGIATMIASFTKRRAVATATCGFLAFAMFIFDYVGRFWDAVKPYGVVSPFRYFSPFAMIGGAPLPRTDALVLIAIFVVTMLIANVAYSRRDL